MFANSELKRIRGRNSSNNSYARQLGAKLFRKPPAKGICVLPYHSALMHFVSTARKSPENVVFHSGGYVRITPCSPLKINRRVGGTCRLHLHGRTKSQARNQRQAGSKRRLTLNGLHSVLSQTTELFWEHREGPKNIYTLLYRLSTNIFKVQPKCHVWWVVWYSLRRWC
jgi:hypothetical protein